MDNLFALLDSFGLTDPATLGGRLKDWGDEEFRKFFDTYAESARSQPLIVRSGLGSTEVFPDSATGAVPLALIRQLCVYVSRFYIHDPILSLGDEHLTLHSNFERVAKTNSKERRIDEFRGEFARTISSLLPIRPLVEAGVVHVSPTSLLRERPEPGAIYATDMYGPGGRLHAGGEIRSATLELPASLSGYVNDHLVVLPVRFERGRPIVIVNEELKPTNSIAVQFEDGVSPMIYCLSNVSVKSEQKDRATLEMRFSFDPSDQDIDPDTFRQWVLGESQKYVSRRLSDLNDDLYMASLAGAHFLTSAPSSCALATVDLSDEPSPHPILDALLKLELPFLSGVTIDELAKARQNEAAFNDFRVALDKALKQIESLSGEERRRRLDEIVRDIIHAPLSRLDRRMHSLNRDVFIDATLALGTLVTNYISGGSTLLTLAFLAASAKALESYKKGKSEQDRLREHPSLFYWELTKAARAREAGRP